MITWARVLCEWWLKPVNCDLSFQEYSFKHARAAGDLSHYAVWLVIYVSVCRSGDSCKHVQVVIKSLCCVTGDLG